MIDWNDPDYQSTGHFYSLIKSVTIDCTDLTSADANTTSYVYTSNDTNPAITFSNASTMVDGALTLGAVDVRLPTLFSAVLVGLALISLI